MACFIVPMAEAIVVTVAKNIVKKKERKTETEGNSQTGLKWSRKLSWLNNLLWGGVLLLAVEHLWHGEIVPWPPFLTAINNPADLGLMLQEVATIGMAMAIFITIVWGIMVLIVEQKVKAISAKVKTEV